MRKLFGVVILGAARGALPPLIGTMTPNKTPKATAPAMATWGPSRKEHVQLSNHGRWAAQAFLASPRQSFHAVARPRAAAGSDHRRKRAALAAGSEPGCARPRSSSCARRGAVLVFALPREPFSILKLKRESTYNWTVPVQGCPASRSGQPCRKGLAILGGWERHF